MERQCRESAEAAEVASFGRSGRRTGQARAGVECSACHGDGLLHVLNPARGGS